MKKVELLAPAGNMEKLKMAITYGADAVYIGGEEYGLRANAGNFDQATIKEAVKFVHSKGKKIYLTMNIIPHNDDFEGMSEYAKFASEAGIDAIILSDPGVFSIVRDAAPNMEIHLSTQANNTNWRSAEFWHKQGVKRIILARELSLKEIKDIRSRIPEDLQLEIFVHGAMCISYSGRCLLSGYMADRDSNRGLCAHSCRWKYHLVEEKRPGEYYPVYENERGTFIFNSKDLCMIGHIPEIVNAGVESLKIEGRMKSSYYVATVVKAYREAIDSYYSYIENMGSAEGYCFNEDALKEVSKASHREFTTGFYFNKTTGEDQIYNTSSYIRGYDFVGLVTDYDKTTGIATVEQRNKLLVGEEIEFVSPKGKFFTQIINRMKNEDGDEILSAPHPQMSISIPIDQEVEEYTILRRKSED